jgi:hypothetical protein
MNKEFVPFGNMSEEHRCHHDGSPIDYTHESGWMTSVSFLHWNYRWIEYEGKKVVKENGNDVREVYKTTDIMALFEQFGFHGWELVHFDQRNCILRKPTGKNIPFQRWEYGKFRHGISGDEKRYTFSFTLYSRDGEHTTFYKANCEKNLLSSLLAELGYEGWELTHKEAGEPNDAENGYRNDYYHFKRSILNFHDQGKYPYDAVMEAYLENLKHL